MNTNINVVAIGGALASLILYAVQFGIGLALGEEVQFAPGIEGALATIIIAGLAYKLPDDFLRKVKERTAEKEGPP